MEEYIQQQMIGKQCCKFITSNIMEEYIQQQMIGKQCCKFITSNKDREMFERLKKNYKSKPIVFLFKIEDNYGGSLTVSINRNKSMVLMGDLDH
jgi:hypothetical protein